MEKKTIHPENFEERVVWYSITYTYVFYLFGALYIVAPVIGWIMFAYLLKQLWRQNGGEKLAQPIIIPIGVWVWVVAMLAMLIALWLGHIDWELGTAKTVKSTVGWAKGWALMAIFPLIGCLNIRPEVIYRATSIVCLQTLIIFPVLLLAFLLRLPQELYISPLQIVGGPGPEFFKVSLYSITPEGGVRWFLFAPWAPAVGFIASIYMLFALQQEKHWFWIGLIGSLLMIVICKSRLALVVAIVLPLTLYFMSNIFKLSVLMQGAVGSLLAGIFAPKLIEIFDSVASGFRAARADSSRVREALGRIAVERWQSEAPIWGHGIVERGPHLVEYMPIGSHHSWYGLLFVKGIVGFAALAIAVVYSFIELLVKSQTSETAKVGLGVIIILFLYTFGENLEILSYLFWPALIVLGIAHKEPYISPFAENEERRKKEARVLISR
ncbi:MAG: O-antigen ligase domain-containing protein [Kangiellaceae bacterium]|nr:O-antigen ligase domain-containing protein [Kangiellaceae bacterium]